MRVPRPGDQEGSRFQVKLPFRSSQQRVPVLFDVRLRNVPDDGADACGQGRIVAVIEGRLEKGDGLAARVDEVVVNLPGDARIMVGEQVEQRFDVFGES